MSNITPEALAREGWSQDNSYTWKHNLPDGVIYALIDTPESVRIYLSIRGGDVARLSKVHDMAQLITLVNILGG